MWICLLFSTFPFADGSDRVRMVFLRYLTDEVADFQRVDWTLAAYGHFIRELRRSSRMSIDRDPLWISGIRGVIEVRYSSSVSFIFVSCSNKNDDVLCVAAVVLLFFSALHAG